MKGTFQEKAILLEKLKSAQACESRLAEWIVSMHVDAFPLSSREIDRIMNKLHDHICTTDQLIVQAIELLREEIKQNPK